MTTCLYSGLQGLLVESAPETATLDDLNAENICRLVDDHFPQNKKGIVSVFWGVELLDYSLIVDLDNMTRIDPDFQVQNGLIVPKVPLCGTSEDQTHIAMREILSQALDYLKPATKADRQDRYFMITPHSGCCPFRSGKVEVSLEEFEDVLDKYR